MLFCHVPCTAHSIPSFGDLMTLHGKSHRKGASDGVGGAMKCTADALGNMGRDIQTLEELQGSQGEQLSHRLLLVSRGECDQI